VRTYGKQFQPYIGKISLLKIISIEAGFFEAALLSQKRERKIIFFPSFFSTDGF